MNFRGGEGGSLEYRPLLPVEVGRRDRGSYVKVCTDPHGAVMGDRGSYVKVCTDPHGAVMGARDSLACTDVRVCFKLNQ